MLDKYKSLLISNIDERAFSMSSTPDMAENIKNAFYLPIFYVKSLCSLCLDVVFRLSSTLKS